MNYEKNRRKKKEKMRERKLFLSVHSSVIEG